MPILNRLAELFGGKPAAPANALAKSPYVNYHYLEPKDYGLGGSEFPYGRTLLYFNSPVFIRGYRYDKRRDKLETLPKKFNMESVRLFSEAAGDAIRKGIPGVAENISPEVVAAMLLKEGREDLGGNVFNYNDPQSVAIYNDYATRYGEDAAATIANIYDKAKVAKRLKIPFAHAWIGTGTSAYGETGKQYAAETEKFKETALHPKNDSLLRFIRASMAGP